MSDSKSDFIKKRNTYASFMNALDDCKSVFNLEELFFDGKNFSQVLRDIHSIHSENEKNFFQRFQYPSQVSDKYTTNFSIVDPNQSLDQNNSELENHRNLLGYLNQLLKDFNSYENKKGARLILFFVCNEFDSLKSEFEYVYQEISIQNNDKFIFDEIWKAISIPRLVSDITKHNKWLCKVHDYLPPFFDGSSLNDGLYKMTIFQFIATYFKDFGVPNLGIFPLGYSKEYGFYCPSASWKQIKSTFSDVDTKISGDEPVEYDYVSFKHPFLCSLNYLGSIAGSNSVDDCPIIINFSKK
jgi:hypothetical protein